MSREPQPPEPGDETLDRLLTMSADPPRLDPDARARLLTRLERSRRTELAPAAPARRTEPPMTSPSPARLRPIYTYALAVAAAGVLAWGAASLLLPEEPGLQGHVPEDSLAELRNEAARPRLVTLADGSTVILRQGAALRVDGPRRLQLLAGEALLEVAPGSEPFTVGAAAGEVQVRGTKFVLRDDGGALQAGVLRGELRLVNAAGEALLRAGEAASLAPGTAPAQRPAERLSHEVAWARDAVSDAGLTHAAVRRGNLVARFPGWPGEYPLPVRTMDVDVHVEDGVARTTIDQTFFNHTDFQLEGVYSFPLPADAAISRLAMYVDGKLMEAGITERQEGREIYESIVYRRRDPALLEWMQGNEFRLRIFPLPGRTEKRILLSYTQPLESLYGDYSVRVPIPELDLPVGTLRYRVHVKDRTLSVDSCCVDFTVRDLGGERLAEATLHDVPIGEDLALTLYPTAPPPAVTAATLADPGGDYFMARARPSLPQRAEHVARRWVVLHDTSASRSPQELAAQSRFLGHLLRELDEADRLTLLAFDSTVRPLPGGFARVDALDPAAVDQFVAREGRDHVGGSALGLAIDRALELLAADAGPEAPHILYLGDGLLAEAGDAARMALREQLAPAGRPRVTFVAAALGDETDLPLLDELAAATDGLRVDLSEGADLRWQALDLAAALNTARVHGLRAALLGEGDVVLARSGDDRSATYLSARSAADGEAVVLLSRGTGSPVPKAILLEGTLAGAPWSQRLALPAATPGAAYIPRLWARARIDADLRAGAEAHRAEITALGREHFLVTPFTSLLVLENEAMYRQYKVSRPDSAGWAPYAAPAEIAVVHEPRGVVTAGPGQVVLRRPIGLVGAAPHGGWADPPAQFGGGLGLIGVGSGGSGFGEPGIGLGRTGSIGFGGEPAPGFGGRGTRVSDRITAGLGPILPVTPDAASFVSTPELARRNRWQRDASPSESSAAPMPASRRVAGFMPEFGEARRVAGLTQFSGRGQPLALHHLGDPHLGDLGEHVPALFEDGFDRAREQLLLASVAAPEGSISAEARDLLTRARASLKPARYVVDGGVLAISGDGHFTRSRTIGGYLRELVRYDGETLVASYPELGLAVERRVGLAEPALLTQWAPWLLPSPESLARWYVVDRLGDRGLRLQQRGSDEHLELQLDEALRLVRISRHRGDRQLAETRFAHDDRGLTITSDGQPRRLEFTSADPDLTGIEAATTTLQLPLRSHTELSAELAKTTPGDPAWRALQRQRIASLAALGQHHQLPAVIAELRAHGPLTRGELVLAGAGLLLAEARQADAALAELPGDPVAAYLAALRRARRGQTGALEQVAKASRGTLPGLLAGHARLLADVSPRGPTRAGLERLREQLATYDHPELAYVATHQLAGTYNWRDPAAMAPPWEALAERSPLWRPVALHAAGTAYQYAGKLGLAGDRFERSLAAAVDSGQIAPIDHSVRAVVQRAGAPLGWQVQWNRWRAAVQKSGDAAQLVAFLAAARTLGTPEEIHRVIAGSELAKLDPDAGATLVLQLLRAGLPADARQVLQPLLAADPEHPSLLALAAVLAEQQGDLAAAAALGERALAAESELSLTDLRAAYGSLLDLRARIATTRATRPAATPDPLDAALDVAARWRAEDPDNPEIDERCATLLLTLGQRAEAMRHLESIVERHPALGESHARVARLLEREGQLDEAELRWRRATAVEPTDPTALIGRARNRLAAGDLPLARALVDQVLAGKWQDRFWAAREDARALKDQLAERER